MKIKGMTILKLSLAILFLAISFDGYAVSDEYSEYLKSQKESFQTYKDSRDAEFIGFLKEQWQEFKVHKGLTRDDKPKPPALPVAEPQRAEPVIAEKIKVVEPIVVPPYKPEEKIVVPPVKDPGKPLALKIDFFMTPISIYGKYNFPNGSTGPINKEVITSFWDKMSQLDYDSIISQVQVYQKQLKLNDWGYHYILYRIGMEQYSSNKNMANLFVWYMSSKSGYESRIGYNNSQVFLLMPSRNRLYSVPFLTLNGNKYYSLFFDEQPEKFKSLFTYKGSYPDADKLMDYRILDSPEISKIIREKNLAFDYKQNNLDVKAQYNKNLVDFFKYYPQTNIKVYFDALVSPELEYTLLKSLKPMVEGKTEVEAVNTLLRFVQKSFSYKTDDGQFGHEKYMLPEETVFYPYSDCEDRSFFFAYLVKKLLNLDVVGLDYPGHISTAVKFTDNLPGDYVVRNNKKYMICDPTYINARLGMAMPQFKNVKPEIIKIDNL
ncbi:MAG: hypothetical protein KKD44_22005 [Proteobacteria bacterium]|nr:hypothetical protein [Pseudomonadota bacterium]